MSKMVAVAIGARHGVGSVRRAGRGAKIRRHAALAINDMFGGLDPLHFPHDEGGSVTRTIYETLVAYDERKHVFVPRLAKAWRRIDDKTTEFDLREDVKFHNGDKFDRRGREVLDRLRARPRDPHPLQGALQLGRGGAGAVALQAAHRLQERRRRPICRPSPTGSTIFDSKVHRKLENKADYGRVSPVTTGPYKVVSYDTSKGIVLERFDDYYEKSGNYRAPMKRVVGIPIPDRQTQLAQFLTGGIDLMRDVPADTAREIAEDAEREDHGDAERHGALRHARRGRPLGQQGDDRSCACARRS